MSEDGIQKGIEEGDDKTYKRPVGTIFPTFFIGVGGCGSGIVDNIRKYVTSRPDYEERYKDLVQFMAFDTDQDDLKSLEGIEGYLISDFPKGEYVRLQTGKEYIDPDPFFTQWWPDWYASRPDSTKGAGQIRVESRLSLYYQFDQDKSQIISRINGMILKSKDHDNPYRAVRPPAAYVYIFCSVAGGTGSGGILTLGYLMKELLKAQRLSPIVVGNLVLPTLFYRKVRTRLHDDIKSNGYAALKELEWFMTLGYNNNPRMMRGECVRAEDDKIEFNYNPLNRPDSGNTTVNMPPFDLINVIDQPGDFAFRKPQDIYPAIAGAAYVQLFSPIMGQRESEEDNYYKKIKHLENGFSRNWGTFGLSMLVLPDKEIHEYCSYQLAQVLTRDLGGSGSSADLFDQVAAAAREELNAGRKSPQTLPSSANIRYLYDAGLLERVFTEEDDQVVLTNGFGDKDWRQGVYQQIEGIQEEVFGTIRDSAKGIKKDWTPKLPADAPPDIASTINDLEGRLKSDYGGRITNFQKEVESIIAQDLVKALEDVGKTKEGRKFDPIGVRLAIGKMVEKIRDEGGGSDLQSVINKISLDDALKGTLQQLAEKSVRERLPGQDDDWMGAEDAAQSSAKNTGVEAAKGSENWAEDFLQSQIGELLGAQLAKAGQLGELSEKLLENLKAGAKKVVADMESGASREFVLDSEVLKGLRTRKRYWDNLWRWVVENKGGPAIGCAISDRSGQIESEMGAVLSLKQRVEDKLQELAAKVATKLAGKGGGEAEVPMEEQLKQAQKVILQECRRRLVPAILGRRQAGDDRGEKGLLIDDCLWLEAKWELEELYIKDHLVNYGDTMSGEDQEQLARDLAAKNEPMRKEMTEYINEKVRFICEKSRVLARLRLTESSAVDPFIFVALSSHYEQSAQVDVGEESSVSLPSLWEIVNNAHPMLKSSRKLDDWVDEKRIAFYQGQAGLPVHNFWPVNGELLESYERVYRNYVSGSDPNAKPKADFPSHIDKAFEDPDEWNPHAVLPSLEPDRKVAGGGSGEQAFYQLLSHDLIQEIPVGKDESGGDRDARIKSISTTILKAVFGSGATGDGLQALRLKQTVEDALAKDRASLEDTAWYALHVPEAAKDPGISSILQNSLPAFAVALGARIDKAFDTYRQDFRKGNRKLAAQLDSVLRERSDKVAAEEDPSAYRAKLESIDTNLKELQGRYMLLAEQGQRVAGFLRFLEEALMQVRGLYTNFQAGGNDK